MKTHTKNHNGQLININELATILMKRETKAVSLIDLDKSTINITKKSGFSEKRFREVDETTTIIIDEHFGIIDGRHRVIKRFLMNKRLVSVKIARKKDIENCLIK